jgi:hypothetical protein
MDIIFKKITVNWEILGLTFEFVARRSAIYLLKIIPRAKMSHQLLSCYFLNFFFNSFQTSFLIQIRLEQKEGLIKD